MPHPWIKFALSQAPPIYRWNPTGGEPLLTDVLSDPIVHRLMASDGVEMTAMMALISHTQRRL